MAEDAVVGQATLERLFEGVDRIDALADEGTVVEQVLVHIGNGAGIGVDTGIAAKQAGVGRACRARQADAHPWLEDGVSADDPAALFIEYRMVQRVHHGADTLARDIPWQQGIGVQGNDEAHRTQGRDITDNQGKAILTFASQQCV
ncbi:hypothetical protein D3C72_1468550 [compost metagenome]